MSVAVPYRRHVFEDSVRALHNAGVDNPTLDARLLMAAASGMDSADFLIHGNAPFTGAEQYAALLQQRLAGVPVSRILGRREFWSLSFALSPHTLDPRADSETCIQAVLTHRSDRHAPHRILDLGTGSGCLLLTLLHEYPAARGVGVDMSAEALFVAQRNAQALTLAARTTFIESHWDEKIEGQFDVIVSNPPYIPAATIATLAREVRDHDPRLALDGGEDGLDCYRQLAPVMVRRLAPRGIAVLEIGDGQGHDVTRLMEALPLRVIDRLNDLSHTPRALVLTHIERTTS